MRIRLALCALLMSYVGNDIARTYAQTAHTSIRHGIVHGDKHVFVDDGGAFLGRGASLFWALWAYEHDRARLARNLATLRDWGFHYIRVLGVIGAPDDRSGSTCAASEANCDSWRDRRTKPDAENYVAQISGLTDWAYKEYGLRTEWTIFGGTELTPTPESRRAVVERFAAMSKGREAAIFAFEIANESFKNGFGTTEGRNELRSLAGLLKSRTQNLVALSSPEGSNCQGAQELYGGSAADLLTVHVGRAGEEDGAHWRAMREIWDMRACTGIPPLIASNEPIGPESSVVSLDDPLALTAMSLVSYASGMGAVVFHSGPGVRGGGQADVALGRRSNLWELPTAPDIARGFRSLEFLLPADAANWTKIDGMGQDSNRPFDVSDRGSLAGLYCANQNPEFFCAAVGITRSVTLTGRRPLRASIQDLLGDGGVLEQMIPAGKPLQVSATPAAVLIRGRLE